MCARACVRACERVRVHASVCACGCGCACVVCGRAFACVFARVCICVCVSVLPRPNIAKENKWIHINIRHVRVYARTRVFTPCFKHCTHTHRGAAPALMWPTRHGIPMRHDTRCGAVSRCEALYLRRTVLFGEDKEIKLTIVEFNMSASSLPAPNPSPPTLYPLTPSTAA